MRRGSNCDEGKEREGLAVLIGTVRRSGYVDGEGKWTPLEGLGSLLRSEVRV